MQNLQLRNWVLLAGFFLSSLTSSAGNETFEEWLVREEHYSTGALFLNVSPPGTLRGVVIASPSRHEPDYFYHWVRDAGLVMDGVATMHAGEKSRAQKIFYSDILMDFAAFSRESQRTFNLSGGLGEPKFYVDGRPYDKGWARPQNDGPAIRALALIRFAKSLIQEGRVGLVRERLYDGRMPAESVIKADLEFVAHHWRETSFDVWEEVRGMHFFTLLFQRKSLLEGADLAETLQDFGAAAFYREQAEAMRPVIEQHWDSRRGYIVATLGRDDGIDYKYSGLDSAVIIAALRAESADGFFAPEDDRVLATAQKIEESFAGLYPINWNRGLGTSIGRYPEDQYDGYVTGSLGNPWVLSTCSYAELYHRIATNFETRGKIEITPRNIAFFRGLRVHRGVESGEAILRGDSRFNSYLGALRERGDDYFRRVRYHSNPDGSLSEQMNRFSGFQQGARDLTWSYAACLTAMWVR